MSHDFAKQRAARTTRASKPPASAWIWFMSGIVVGVFLSFLVYLTTMAPPPKRSDAATNKKPVTAAETSGIKEHAAAKPQFDFYTLLPESEVIVGERAATGSSATTAASPAQSKSSLLLQAGSFRQPGDAERRRAEIILLGYEARVETVTIPNEATWYRVHVGPFANTEALAQARRALLAQHIDTLEISQRQR